MYGFWIVFYYFVAKMCTFCYIMHTFNNVFCVVHKNSCIPRKMMEYSGFYSMFLDGV